MRGLAIFLAIVGVGAVFCGLLPFVLLPDAGYGVALPVIYVPGEKLDSLSGLFGFDVTNTIFASWIVIAVVFLWVIPIVARRKEVPGRGQALVEMIVELWDGLAKSSAGAKGRQLVPLALSIFFFLLVANLMKIVPGVDTIGELHCAGIHQGGDNGDFIQVNGYPIHSEPEGVVFLKVERVEGKAVNTGEKITEEEYEACHHELKGKTEEKSEEATTEEHAEEAAEGEATEVAAAATAEAGEEGETEEAAPAATTEEGEGGAGEGATEEEHAAEEEHAVNPGRYIVTPFVRGASTDLALTLSIALIAIVVVQYFGFKELGVGGYATKFINTPALEKVGKNPMGVMDFAVGILELFLETFKIISFAFRLFGAMFGGQVLMFVIVFLVAFLVPMAVIGLELFFGVIQAFVFAILFVMFSASAMTSHHHDEEHDEAHAHH